MADFKLTPQESITFLQNYIDAVNAELDEMLGGEDFKSHIKSLKFRIELLMRDKNPRFEARLAQLKEELDKLEEEFRAKNPQIEALEAERVYYRKLLNEVSS